MIFGVHREPFRFFSFPLPTTRLMPSSIRDNRAKSNSLFARWSNTRASGCMIGPRRVSFLSAQPVHRGESMFPTMAVAGVLSPEAEASRHKKERGAMARGQIGAQSLERESAAYKVIVKQKCRIERRTAESCVCFWARILRSARALEPGMFAGDDCNHSM